MTTPNDSDAERELAIVERMEFGTDRRSMAESNTILRAIVGSTLYGTSLSDSSDRDELGICVEPWEHHFGLRSRFEQYQWRTKPEGERLVPGDSEGTIYGLSKWARLALGGNPTILMMLFVPDRFLTVATPRGRALMGMAPMFVADSIFDPHMGCLRSQRRFFQRCETKGRPELVERYGFDTKHAGQMLRVGYQGIELAETGRLTLPMREHERQRVLDVRLGRVPLADILEQAEAMESKLVAMRDAKHLGPPNHRAVEAFVLDCYMEMHPR